MEKSKGSGHDNEELRDDYNDDDNEYDEVHIYGVKDQRRSQG